MNVVSIMNNEAVSFGELTAVYGVTYSYSVNKIEISPIKTKVEQIDALIDIYTKLYETKRLTLQNK